MDQIWLAVEPMDMRAGPDTALARVVKDFGAAHPHHAYVFANKRANRMKILVHDGLASSGLLAHVLVAKYADHLPLYRQQKIFERAGVKLSISTMADWVGVCGVRLQPLVDALRETIPLCVNMTLSQYDL